jgi:hypothetical protein
MISNAPEFLANFATAVYDEDPIYFDTQRAWREFPWDVMVRRELSRILNQPARIWERYELVKNGLQE